MVFDTYLMIGLGKIGLAIAQTLLSQGKNVIGVSRHLDPILDIFKHYPKFIHIQGDASQLNPTQIQPFSQVITHICIIVSPDQSTLQAYRNSYLAICQNIVWLNPYFPKLQRVVFISSTSVYGQNAGEIIDITTPMQPPKSATTQVLLQAEAILQQCFGRKCTIIRPSGIYGKGRLRLVTMANNLTKGTAALPDNHWTNRIFDTDLIHIIVNILNDDNPLSLYIASDNLSVPLYEVLNWLAREMKLNLALPPTLPTSGKRLIHNLPSGWLEYGNFQAGYRAVLENFSTQ